MAARASEAIEHLWTLICHAVRQDPFGISAIGLMDMLAVPDLPSAPSHLGVQFFVLSAWRRNQGGDTLFHQRLVLQYDDAPGQPRVQLSGAERVDLRYFHVATVVTPVLFLPLQGYGQYFIVVQRQREGTTGDDEAHWEDVLPAAGLWIAAPTWTNDLPPDHPIRIDQRMRLDLLSALRGGRLQQPELLVALRQYQDPTRPLLGRVLTALSNFVTSGDVDTSVNGFRLTEKGSATLERLQSERDGRAPGNNPRERLKHKVRSVLEASRSEMLTTDVLQHVRADDFPELLTTLGAEIYSALKQLQHEGEVESIGPGRWRIRK